MSYLPANKPLDGVKWAHLVCSCGALTASFVLDRLPISQLPGQLQLRLLDSRVYTFTSGRVLWS